MQKLQLKTNFNSYAFGLCYNNHGNRSQLHPGMLSDVRKYGSRRDIIIE
jgi:hypothetical protein